MAKTITNSTVIPYQQGALIHDQTAVAYLTNGGTIKNDTDHYVGVTGVNFGFALLLAPGQTYDNVRELCVPRELKAGSSKGAA